MAEEPKLIFGITAEEWAAAYRLGVQEFAASRFVVKSDNGMIRIGFGNDGPPVPEGAVRTGVYTHAATIPTNLALTLSKFLRDAVAAPEEKKK